MERETEPRTEFLVVRLTPREKLAILAATRRSTVPHASTWARNVMLAAANGGTTGAGRRG